MKVISFDQKIGTNGLNRNHRKEKSFYESLEVVTIEKGQFKNPISLRFYGTNAMNYACLWINGLQIKGESVHVSGSGSAGGYGYHRASQAAENALQNAGFKFDTEIGGRGETAIKEAIEAVCKYLGAKKFTIINAHA